MASYSKTETAVSLAKSLKSFAKSAAVAIAPELLYDYQLYKKRDWEPELKLVPSLCDKTKTSIDVGANIGLFCKAMLPCSAAVVAFEPLPAMAQRLTRHFGDKIRLEQVALSDSEGETEIRMPAGLPSWATIEPKNALPMAGDRSLELIAIMTKPLDSYGFDSIGFMKIDVEGHEENVLHGGVKTIALHRPNVLIEVEERHNPGSVERVRRFFEQLGYTGVFSLDGVLTPMSQFDLARDQPLDHVGVAGKFGRYINNFIYRPA
jgi:FkbM family methyltransferase